MEGILKSLGLTEKEAHLYLILNSREKLSIADIMKKTKIERRSIYDILEKLIQKGFASFFEEEKRKYYLATNPEIILEDLKEKEEDFKSLIPKINRLKEKESGTKVEILKGIKGLKTIFLEISKTKSTHYAFGNIMPLLEKEYSGTLTSFLNSIEGRNLKEYIIYPQGSKIRKLKGSKYKEIDNKLIPPTPTVIYDDKTIQFIFTSPLTIIKITNKEIAKTNLKYFETFWKMAN